jgi:hypothetical protein
MNLHAKLLQRAAAGKPVRVGMSKLLKTVTPLSSMMAWH